MQPTTEVCLSGPWPYLHSCSHNSSGVFGKETLKFVQDLGHPLKLASRENSAYLFLLQRLSVAIQQGDAASVMGSLGSEQMEIFFVSLMSICAWCKIMNE